MKIKDLSSKDGDAFVITGITMAGYDYLDSVRNNSTWIKVKNVISSKGLDITFDIVKSVFAEIAKTAITG